jgi:hypothetical protein
MSLPAASMSDPSPTGANWATRERKASDLLWRALLLPQVVMLLWLVWNQGQEVRYFLQYGRSSHSGVRETLAGTLSTFLQVAALLFLTIGLLGFSSRLRYPYVVVGVIACAAAVDLFGWFVIYALLALVTSVLSFTIYRERFQNQTRLQSLSGGLIFVLTGIGFLVHAFEPINDWFDAVMILVVPLGLIVTGIHAISESWRTGDLPTTSGDLAAYEFYVEVNLHFHCAGCGEHLACPVLESDKEAPAPPWATREGQRGMSLGWYVPPLAPDGSLVSISFCPSCAMARRLIVTT